MRPMGHPGLGRDLQGLRPVRRLVRLRAFQFALVLPTGLAVGVALVSAAVGLDHPHFNFGTTFTWVAQVG